MKRARSGFEASLLAYLLWGFITIYWRHLRRLDAIELIGQRVLLSCLVLVAIVIASRRWRAVQAALFKPRVLGQMTLAAVLLIANWTAYVYAVFHGHILETALGYFMAPIATMLIGIYAMKEPVRLGQWLSIALASVAVVVIAVSYGKFPWIALLLGSSWSTYGFVKRKIPLAAVESLAGETVILAVPALIVVITRHAQGRGIFQVAASTEIVLLLFSGVVTAVPLLLFTYAAKRTPFTILGPVGYLVPTINFLLGVILYHEQLHAAVLVGFILVWIALATMTIESLRGVRGLHSVP